MNAKEAYETDIKAQLRGLDAQVQDMMERVDAVNADVRNKYRQRLEDLKSQRNDLQNRFKEVHESTEAAWRNLRRGVDEALNAFTEAVSDARAEFAEFQDQSEKHRVI